MADEKKVAIGLGIAGAVTAAVVLATRAKAKPPPPPPGLANLYGKVTNAVTGKKITDVLVTLDGIGVYTDEGGGYSIENLEPWGYTIEFAKAGYEGAVEMVTLNEGLNELNVGLVPIAPPVASLYGVVTDAETGYPIAGVKVTIDGVVAYTDASGVYGFEGLEPGSYTLIFEKAGYETLTR